MRVLIHWDKIKIIHICNTCYIPSTQTINEISKQKIAQRFQFNTTNDYKKKNGAAVYLKKMKHTKNQMQTPIIIIKIQNEKSFRLQTRIRNPIWMIQIA